MTLCDDCSLERPGKYDSVILNLVVTAWRPG